MIFDDVLSELGLMELSAKPNGPVSKLSMRSKTNADAGRTSQVVEC